ncbi:alkaline phosphatase family protein [Stygiolobus caldivivus]|uniref:Nucleotide pyrophosphatase n=1 Tax=Stygiolobus caldivivus TaxID=2824673 RepID=A0A8D5ZIE0_9CREN|nr:alkaline phosphatase family protein [Stygiolobus caldivivus]BCU69526.1 nucleotide pyrophosphatase [Stygiolobus caldivivus]
MELVYPEYTSKSLYNLACGIAEFLGVERVCKGNKIGIPGKRLVLALVDGMGYKMMENAGISVDSYITTVFPSTTATVITTLFTAQLPGEHGVLGYTTYSKKLGGVINTLKYTYPLIDSRDSISSQVKYSVAFPKLQSYPQEVKDKKTAEVIPKGLEGTEFTDVTHGKVSNTKTYSNYFDAFYMLGKTLEENYDFVYFYIPDVDTLAHKHGPNTDVVKEAIRSIYDRLVKLAEKNKEYTFVIIADHGHVQTNEHVIFNNDSDLLNKIDVPPYGDSRAIFLHSRYDLKTYLYSKYPTLEVFPRTEFEKLLGREGSYADYIAVPKDDRAYVYLFKQQQDDYTKLIGHHGGLSEDEMKIPLVIING